MEQKEYSVSEAVRLVGVESHVLRYWEEELQIEIRRTSQGHRIYSEQNIEIFRKVRELKEHGLQLKAIRVLLDKSEGDTAKAELTEQIFDIGNANTEQGLHEGTEIDLTYDVALSSVPEQGADDIGQFEAILKRLVGEVIDEKNQRLEQTMQRMIREELEQYLLRYQDAVSEAAAEMESADGKRGILGYIRRKIKKNLP